MKKITMILLLCFSLFLILQPVSSVRAADYFDEIAVKVVLNGEEIQFEPTAIVWNVTTLVPFRQLFEAYGAEVDWDPVTKQVTANKADTTIGSLWTVSKLG